MSTHLKLVLYGDPVLKKPADRIEHINDEIRDLASGMIEVMDRHAGMGLAAPQVGISKRLIVVRVEDDQEPTVLVNPEITHRCGLTEKEEGCLSLPGIAARVRRAEKIRVEGTALEGKRVELDAEGITARAFQHEIDHIDGILFIDRLGKKQLKAFTDMLEAIERGEVPPVLAEQT